MYSTEVGKLLVIWLTGATRKYIAEVTQETPLRLKVQETGPYANLKEGDFIILKKESIRAQDDQESTQLLQEEQERGYPLISGLASLGVKDGKIREILPVRREE